jgi:BirA family transcriptional regulator, biotin operon repressor / biotin---[acetyl-CoA-carboxylase] ligase
MQLDPIALDAGMRLVALDSIGSTNKEALKRAQYGETGPLWITALQQTDGRGRMDRRWISPQGNLYSSLLLSEPSPFERAPELAFVAILALRDAIVAEAPALAQKLSFKWPNDLLLGSEKCAGILIEGEVSREGSAEPSGRQLSVVIGLGVNCESHPATVAEPAETGADASRLIPSHAETVLYPATNLRAHGAGISPQQLFRRLSATMCRRIEQWHRGDGFPAILGDWLTSACGIGEEVTVREGGGERHGRFVGLDRTGRMVLEVRGGGMEKISAGDVFPFRLRGGQRIPGRV